MVIILFLLVAKKLVEGLRKMNIDLSIKITEERKKV